MKTCLWALVLMVAAGLLLTAGLLGGITKDPVYASIGSPAGISSTTAR
jgi:hypothetical protein